MLPRLNQRLPPLPYSSFTQELISKRISDSNINKLKLLKQFLEQDQFYILNAQTKLKSINHLKVKPHRSISNGKTLKLKTNQQRQGISLAPSSSKHSLAQEINHLVSQHSQKEKQNNIIFPRHNNSIFAMPDRFRLNDILLLGKCRGKDFIGNSISSTNKARPHRIL